MARFMILWHLNTAAPVPMDPAKQLEMQEPFWALIDGMIKKGEIEDFGIFPDGYSGYAIHKSETADLLRHAITFQPWVIGEVHEIIPFEKSKEITRAVLKAQIAAMKK